ncbi:MAG: hypothetical protein GF364_00415, partial [Candidatus Lokiarchaeota archaeon]|nr:hypothetical protein [Candidatus Lokiarchaeota archaeon]
MRYMFRVLVLGDPLSSVPFIVNGDVEHVSQDYELSRWSKTLNTGYEERCDLEIDVVVSESTDYDNLIPTSDGILYFLNPNKLEEFELFEMISDILLELKRQIPIIVIFYDKDGFIKLPSNALVEYIWENYPFDAFVFNKYSKNKLYEILECLCEAMINSTMPINVQTAWLRVPFLIDKINRLVMQEEWRYAAQLTELLSQIRNLFGKTDYYITAEQSAWLYFKTGDFLKASSLLEKGINKQDAKKFKEFYVRDLLHQGDRAYKVKRFRNAAERYEKAALWSSIELEDNEIYDKAMNDAITTWISACEFSNAFKLMEKLDHNERLKKMDVLTPKIAGAADYLIQNKNYAVLKAQLYYCIDKYQRAGLFESVEIFAEKIVKVMKIILQQDIENKSPDSALLTLDELFNIWETFELEPENLDSIILKIVELFLQKHEFSIIENLLSRVNDIEVKKQISEKRSDAEEKYAKTQQSLAQEDYNKAVAILEKYIQKERDQFSKENQDLIDYVNDLLKDNQHWDASLILKQKADWYKSLNLKIFHDELVEELLKVYLKPEKPYIIQFLQEINNLPNNKRTKFIDENHELIFNAMEKRCQSHEPLEKLNNLLEKIIKLFRNHLLYEKSKIFTKQQVRFIISCASDKLFASDGLDEVKNVLKLLKEADMIYGELSEKEPLVYDKILEEIVNRYISDGN